MFLRFPRAAHIIPNLQATSHILDIYKQLLHSFSLHPGKHMFVTISVFSMLIFKPYFLQGQYNFLNPLGNGHADFVTC